MSLTCSMKARGRRFLAFLLPGVLWLAACAPPEAVTLTPATEPVTATITAPAGPPTLPPTWTPTFTPTPLPPTATLTATLTPSITPTLSDADRCASFVLVAQPRDGGQFPIRGSDQGRRTLGFIWQYPLGSDEAVGLLVSRAGTDLGRMVTLPGPTSAGLTLPFDVLYGTGVYHWQIGPLDDDGVFLYCAQSGTFSLVGLSREAQSWATPEARPTQPAPESSATPAQTAAPSPTPTPRRTPSRTPTPILR